MTRNEQNLPAVGAPLERHVRPQPEHDLAHRWRVRFALQDGYYTFTDIGSASGLPIPKAAASAWGLEELRKNPERYSSVASVYSIDHEA
jgi:hypothetical protein